MARSDVTEQLEPRITHRYPLKMSTCDLSYPAWLARRGCTTERLAVLNRGLPPYRRERLRGAVEADVLRRTGTPECMIGPVGTDDDVQRERAALVLFARRLRDIADGQ
jgi:hypothetical protein